VARICMCASRRRVESVCGCARGVHVHASLVELRACVGAREARMCMLIGVELRACVGAREACMCVRVVVFREHVCLRVWCACAHESAQLVHTAPHCSSCCGRARASGLVPRLVHAAPFFVSSWSCACRRAYVSLGACGATLRIVVVVARARDGGLMSRLVRAAPLFLLLWSCACRRAYVSLGARGATLPIVVVVRVCTSGVHAHVSCV